MIRM